MADMTLERIFEYYKDVTRLNVIKLLIRVRKLYEARLDVKKILVTLIEKETYVKQIYPVLDKKRRFVKTSHEPMLNTALTKIQNGLRQLNNFK